MLSVSFDGTRAAIDHSRRHCQRPQAPSNPTDDTRENSYMSADVLKLIKDEEVKFVDLRFTDTRG